MQFPLRVAAVDVGSNAIRYAAAEFVDPEHYVELDAQRAPVRLGHGAFQTGHLEEDAMAGTVAAMASFRRSLDTLGIGTYRAVATSAVRDSRNGAALIDRVRQESGMRLETITGGEEAQLVWRAVRRRVPLQEGRWLMVDLGGGSLEVSLMDRAGIAWSESHTMGAVRLLEDLAGSSDSPAGFGRTMAEYVATLRIPRIHDGDLAGLIATGGNIEALADLAEVEETDGISVLPLDALRGLMTQLASLTVAERMEQFDLRPDRADVILPAAMLYERVAFLAGADRIMVPRVGVREGVLLDLVERVTTRRAYVGGREREVFAAAVAVGRRYDFDESHARHVAWLASSLFDQLRGLHGLSKNDRCTLIAAALLHDIGQFVSYRKHHKHSMYLIQHAELASLNDAEIGLVALVARYHRRAEPADRHPVFHDLGAKDRDRVRKLSALLRLADSLDREHLQRVDGVEARWEDDVLWLEVSGGGDLLLERWALERKAPLFERTFGVGIRLTTGEDRNERRGDEKRATG